MDSERKVYSVEGKSKKTGYIYKLFTKKQSIQTFSIYFEYKEDRKCQAPRWLRSSDKSAGHGGVRRLRALTGNKSGGFIAS